MGYYYLNGQRITKVYAGQLLGKCYGLPRERATTQFESLAKNYFCINPLAMGYQDCATGIIFSNGRPARARATKRR